MPGCLLVFVAISLVLTLLISQAVLSGVRNDLRDNARLRLNDVEQMIANAVNDLETVGPMLGDACNDERKAVLADRSLAARAVNYLHRVNLRTGRFCSPAPDRHVPTLVGLERALAQTAGLWQSVLLGSSRGGLLIAQPIAGDAAYLVGEITASQLAMHSSFTTGAGVRAILYRWDGAILNDSAGLTELEGTVGWQHGAGGLWHMRDSLSVSMRSKLYPLSVDLLANPVSMIRMGAGYLLLGLLLSLGLSVAVVFGINQWLQRRVSIDRRLRKALAQQEFEPVIQPIVDAQTGHCRGGEVLVRWRHPSRGLLSPAEFLAAADRLGMLGQLTLLIVSRAAAQLAPVLNANPALYVSFNIEAPQLRDAVFMKRFEDIFAQCGLSPARIVIELVEREAVDLQARLALSHLRKNGFRIAIDDFGTGQSSLALLSAIEFDMLKIDRSFVIAADSQAVSLPVLDAILEMAAKLQVKTIAEGVETRAQHGLLISRGVTAIQGYLVARPMPVAQFGRWLYARAGNPGYANVADEQETELGVGATSGVTDVLGSGEASGSRRPVPGGFDTDGLVPV